MSEALWRLKMEEDLSQVEAISQTVAAFIRSHADLAKVAAVIPIPPSDEARSVQPVPLLAQAVGALLSLPSPADYLVKVKQTPLIRTVADPLETRRLLEDAFTVADGRFAGRDVLLLDDVFRSGETLAAACRTVRDGGKVRRVCAVALTWAPPPWDR